MTKAKIPNRLKHFIELKGLTKRQIAQFLGHDKADKISEWEAGKALPDSTSLFKILILLKVTEQDIYGNYIKEIESEIIIKMNENNTKQKRKLNK